LSTFPSLSGSKAFGSSLPVIMAPKSHLVADDDRKDLQQALMAIICRAGGFAS